MIGALVAAVVALLGGCEKPACLGCGASVGIPVLRAVDGGALVISQTDQCSVNLDFGDGGGGAEVLLRVEDIGSGNLDLSQPETADLGLSFSLRLPTLAPVQPGGTYEFGIKFEPSDAGLVRGTLVIETDGDNATCTNPSQLRIALSGSAE